MALQGPKEVPRELLGFSLKPEAHLFSVGTGSPAVPCTLPIALPVPSGVPKFSSTVLGQRSSLSPCLEK